MGVMETGKILYTVIDQTCVLKFSGAIVYNISPRFDQFVKKITNCNHITSFVIDLTNALYIDSTNLGILARLHEITRKHSSLPPTLISSNENINDVLHTVGFSKIFTIVNSIQDIACSLEELPTIESSREELALIMLKAHRELVRLNKTNQELFKDVIKYLEQDTNRFNPCAE